MTSDAEESAPHSTGNPFKGPEREESRPAAELGTAPVARRRRRASRRRLHRRRQIGLAMMLIGAPVVLAGAWILVTGVLARGQLQTVRNEVHQLRTQVDAGDFAAARATASEIAVHARRAHSLTTGPAWAAVAGLPGGEPLRTVRAITAQADALGHNALPQLVNASVQLDPRTLRGPDGVIDLARISAAAPVLDRATSRIERATRAIQAQPAHSWVAAVDNARGNLLTQLTSLSHTLRSADLAANIAPAMLGQHGVQRYFVAFQNDAEARGTGGIPGAFAILRADHGKMTFERFEPDDTLASEPTGISLGPGYDQLFNGARTTSFYVNTNESPNFPYAAQLWLAMWRERTGERLDGALAIDPTALSYLLRVTGPVTLPNTSRVSAENIVDITQSGVYAKFPDPRDKANRKVYLLGLASSVSKRILDSSSNTTRLVKAAGQAAGERRLLVYSAHPNVQADITQTSLSGAIPDTPQPYVGLSIVNDGGNKLDYYLDRSIAWQRSGCGSPRKVTVTIRLANNAPSSGLSPYVTARSDEHAYPVKPGDNRLEVSYYATRGAQMDGVSVAGKPSTAAVGNDLGHPVFVVDLELPRASTRTIVFDLSEPPGDGTPIVLDQPLVRPLHVSINNARCS